MLGFFKGSKGVFHHEGHVFSLMSAVLLELVQNFVLFEVVLHVEEQDAAVVAGHLRQFEEEFKDGIQVGVSHFGMIYSI